jgi:nitrite reductase/ring-hydroxylating ferredoxin subunit
MNESTPIRRRQTVRLNTTSDKRVNDARTQSQYQPYKDAAWGFINHWYPALFSEELGEDKVEGIQICGIPIVLRRVDGKVYALKDQCLHRGVRLSAKPTCFNKSSITCWYHGFTFDLEDGKLSTIVANPNDPLVGTTGITSYPVEELAGMIFVFVREDDYPLEDVPPLSHDLPIRFPESSERFPHPLWPDAPSLEDKGAVALGMHRTGQSNWRIACENGFDNAHILIHMDNTIVHAMDWVLPLGILPDHEEPITLIEDVDGPKGMMQWLFTDRWKPVLENEALGLKIDGLKGRFYRTSVVLPGCLMVENWPEEHVVQYWEVMVRVCETEADREKFKARFERVYMPLCLRGFNDCDLYAREAMEEFYADGAGWDDEQLVATDVSPITWRKVASRWNRGIAKPGRGVTNATKTSSIRLRRLAQGKAPGYFVQKIEDVNNY